MGTVIDVSPSATILTHDEEEISLQVIEAKVETSRYDVAATIEFKGLADASVDEIQDVITSESSASISVNGVTIGSGMLTALTIDEEGVVEVTADDAVRHLVRSGVGQEFTADPAVSVLVDIFQAAGLEAVSQDGGTIGRPGYAIDVNLEVDQTDAGNTEQFYTTRNFTDTNCLSAVEDICRERGWYWYVDETNVVRVVDELEPTQHDIQYVTETTAGVQSPPYRRVVVTGGRGTSITGEDGDGGTHLLDKTRVQGIAWDEAAERDPSVETYRYSDSSIYSAEDAQNVAVGILEEFKRQEGTGVITIVGDPTIRPLDVVVMPDVLGGERYIVSDLVQTLDNSKGFITEIGAGGFVDREQFEVMGTETGPDSGSAAPPSDGGTGGGGSGDTDDDDSLGGDGDSGSAAPPSDDDDDDDDDSGPSGPMIIAP